MYTYYKVMIADVSDAFTYLKRYLDKRTNIYFLQRYISKNSNDSYSVHLKVNIT